MEYSALPRRLPPLLLQVGDDLAHATVDLRVEEIVVLQKADDPLAHPVEVRSIRRSGAEALLLDVDVHLVHDRLHVGQPGERTQEAVELDLVEVDGKFLHIEGEGVEDLAQDVEVFPQEGVVVLLKRLGRALGSLGEIRKRLRLAVDEGRLSLAEDLLVDHGSSLSPCPASRIIPAISISSLTNSGRVLEASFLGRPNGTMIWFLRRLGRAVET